MPDFAKREVLSCLRTLSDRKLQERYWVGGDPSGPASPSELASQLFDDTALADYLEGAQDIPVFGAKTDDLLLRIGDLFDRVDLDAPPADLLNNPRWKELCELAGQAVNLIGDISSRG